MEKKLESWTVSELKELINLVHFPEYQREPNLWGRIEKQRLIDSMVREFDVASLYFYQHEDDVIDCVDGRQRIGAIMEFLGKRPESNDNWFPFVVLNEIEEDGGGEFWDLRGKNMKEIQQESSTGNSSAKAFVDRIEGYQLAVVNLSGGRGEGSEFNLQFTRLNLGTIINSGEKLNAMIGQLRDECYEEGRLGSHSFLAGTGMPTRRYAREHVAAQIVAQFFPWRRAGAYARHGTMI